MRRALAGSLLTVVALAGCGGGSSGQARPRDRPAAAAAAAREPQPIASAAQCLKAAGFRAGGGPVHQPHTNAPDQELVASKGGAFPRGTALFVAYYQSVPRAAQLAPSLRANAKRFNGRLERYGRMTFIWTRTPSAGIRADVNRCVFR